MRVIFGCMCATCAGLFYDLLTESAIARGFAKRYGKGAV